MGNVWPHDNQQELIAFYGNPKRDVPAQLVKVTPPFQFYYTDERGTRKVPYIWFHRKAAPALLAALNEIWDYYRHDQKALEATGITDFGGTYNPRMVRGSATKWSNHAFGAAIDLNAKQNGLGAGHGNMPAPVIAAFKRQGFRWGGDYHGRTDPMHFEACQNAQSYGFAGSPDDIPTGAGDNGFDDTENDDIITANENIEEDKYKQSQDITRPLPWYKKVWNWVSGGGIAAMGVGGYTFAGIEPTTLATILGFALVVLILLIVTKRI